VGLELSGELLGLGVWMEGNHNWMRRESDFARFVVGADYTLEGGTYLLGEALYNGRAEEDAPYPVHDWLANLYYGEPVGRWWILTGAQHDVWPLVAGSLYLFSSPDGSFVFNPRLDVSISQDAELTAFGGVTFGDENGSFPPGLTALIARATVYF
jgi:hypothetical protein